MATEGIIAQFADEASFLWSYRLGAVGAPHLTLYDLVRLDERIEAHIDGLRIAGEAGWEMCASSLGRELPEGYFAPSVLAFESGNQTRIQEILDVVGKDRFKSRALISALGWIPYEKAEPYISNLLASASPFHRYIGISASVAHRRDPGKHLDTSVKDTAILLSARGLRAYGELGREIRLSNSELRENLSDDDDSIRFSMAWSAALSGNAEAVDVLKSFVTSESSYSDRAINVTLRRIEPALALSWQQQLAQSSETLRNAVAGAGIIGDPVLVPWLIEQMKIPELARVAGEAFTMITGVDIEQEEMRGTRSEGYIAGPNDDPTDTNVAMDTDLYLPWPDAGLIDTWWNRNKGRYQCGTRHLLGNPVTPENLRNVLRCGRQRQRAAAALELAILEPERPLFEVRAPGFRQIEMLCMEGE